MNAKTVNLLFADNKVFVNYEAQGDFNPNHNPPLRTPLLIIRALRFVFRCVGLG